MIRQVATGLLALLLAAPASLQAQHRQIQLNPPALRLMNNSQFNLFLKRLDADLAGWKAQLAAMDVASLGAEPQEAREIERSYILCLRGLEDARVEIQKLSQKQTLKYDFLLLVDLNGAIRNLDRLVSNLANPQTVEQTRAVKKSLGWAREVLTIDAALGAHLTELQHHVLAFAGLMDAVLDQDGENADWSKKPK
jgi:hypothetical protein